MSDDEALGCGQLRYEAVALKNRVQLRLSTSGIDVEPAEWWIDTESPHITRFKYDVLVDPKDVDDVEVALDVPDDDDLGSPGKLEKVGTIDGYVLNNDGTDQSLNLWDEADAMDSDIEAYVTYLKLELEAVDVISDGLAPELEEFPRILIVRHFEPAAGVDSISAIVRAVAGLAMKEGPSVLIVDPREMPNLREAAVGKLKGRSHTAALMQGLGLVRMVSCRLVWGWHVDQDLLTNEHSYEGLVEAKREGRLDRILSGVRNSEEG